MSKTLLFCLFLWFIRQALAPTVDRCFFDSSVVPPAQLVFEGARLHWHHRLSAGSTLFNVGPPAIPLAKAGVMTSCVTAQVFPGELVWQLAAATIAEKNSLIVRYMIPFEITIILAPFI